MIISNIKYYTFITFLHDLSEAELFLKIAKKWPLWKKKIVLAFFTNIKEKIFENIKILNRFDLLFIKSRNVPKNSHEMADKKI